MAKYSSMSALKNAMKSALVPAVNSVAKEIEHKIDESVMDYYTDYYPKRYERTGTLSYAPKKKEAVSTDNGAEADVYMDLGLEYHTGTWNMEDVIMSAEAGMHGGYPGGNGVPIWTRPMIESTFEHKDMWADALRSVGFDIK